MIRLAALLCIFALPVMGQEISTHAGVNEIGRLVITNRPVTQTDIYSTHTFGEVEVNVHYHSTPNNLPDPRDIIRISVPDGYVAIPAEVLLPEGETIEIVIYEALIG